jgi:hypothetical protein
VKLPFHLAEDCWIVLEDGYGDRATEVIQSWQEPGGTRMFSPPMLLTTARGSLAELRHQHHEVVLPALNRSTPVTVDGGPWRELLPEASAADLEVAREFVYGESVPSLHVVFPDPCGGHGPGVRELARVNPDRLLLLNPGNRALVSLQIFEAMLRRHLYCTEVHA